MLIQNPSVSSRQWSDSAPQLFSQTATTPRPKCGRDRYLLGGPTFSPPRPPGPPHVFPQCPRRARRSGADSMRCVEDGSVQFAIAPCRCCGARRSSGCATRAGQTCEGAPSPGIALLRKTIQGVARSFWRAGLTCRLVLPSWLS